VAALDDNAQRQLRALGDFIKAQRTMAELSLEEKGRISHRARALDALEPLLRSLDAQGVRGVSRTTPAPHAEPMPEGGRPRRPPR